MCDEPNQLASTARALAIRVRETSSYADFRSVWELTNRVLELTQPVVDKACDDILAELASLG